MSESNLDNSLSRTVDRAIHGASKMLQRTAKRLAFQLLRQSGRIVAGILMETAPFWLPVVGILVLGLLTFAIIFMLPAELVSNPKAPPDEKIRAFFATNDKEEIAARRDFLQQYQAIAAKWREDLSDEEAQAASIHEFSWGVLAAVDRITHDPSVVKSKQLQLDPEKVFQQLRPRFTFRASSIRTESQSCVESPLVDSKGEPQIDNETGVPLTRHELVTDAPMVVQTRLMMTADTLEGHYQYRYRDDRQTLTDSSSNPCGVPLTTIVTREVMEHMDAPTADTRYQPLFDYLKTHGIDNKTDIEIVMELAKAFDSKLGGNLALVQYQPYLTGQLSEMGFLFPIPYTSHLTTEFGAVDDWHSKPHDGIDLANGKCGTEAPLYAAADGTVTVAGPMSGFGQAIMIQHKNGVVSLYGHVEASGYQVKPKEDVKAGQYIGQIGCGKVGSSTGPHLHFSIYVNGNATNPFYFTQPKPNQVSVRLDGKEVWVDYWSRAKVLNDNKEWTGTDHKI